MKDYLDDFVRDVQCEEYYGHWTEEEDEDDLPDYIDD